MSTFSALPPELYSAIFEHVPLSHIRLTILSLTRALPWALIPQERLFRDVSLGHSDQVVQFYRRLRNGVDSAGRFVRSFAVKDWNIDAELIISIVPMLLNVEHFSLYIGPRNFTPEHLEELFKDCITSLQHVSLRFRPYVKTATYLQFLKGAYFDSTLEALSRWSNTRLHSISIIQDPLDTDTGGVQAFAQPIVFFRFEPAFATLSSCSLASNSRALRVRIPHRSVVRALSSRNAFPRLEFLDLSTCSVLEGELEMILVRLWKVKHIVLDGCRVLRSEGDWNAFGKRLALIGVTRAKEREKQLKEYLERESMAALQLPEETTNIPIKKAKRGRRGLASATISLREPSTTSPARPNGIRRPQIPKIRILPQCPTTLSLAMSTFIPSRQAEVLKEFEQGWFEGLVQMTANRSRLRQSFRNGVVRVVQFSREGVSPFEEGMVGLEDVESEDVFDKLEDETSRVPLLCLASSSGAGGEHAAECPHHAAQEFWGDCDLPS
ncbi:hypothetical protein BDN72DRAFT_766477 [Pluteus cervinus]|uniref:Uncharacterized protein n=1 Tax=Pluteus cervinus TaxID=181527 RepID=A0ACD3AXH6_9AGAR|nr:hypothetical protein BDN72DRAFT_766477 [Pluteus cervinus]